MKKTTTWTWIFTAAAALLLLAAVFAYASIDQVALKETWETLTLPQAVVLAAVIIGLMLPSRKA